MKISMSDEMISMIWGSIPASIRLKQFKKLKSGRSYSRLKDLSYINDWNRLRKEDSGIAVLVAADFKIITRDEIVS